MQSAMLFPHIAKELSFLHFSVVTNPQKNLSWQPPEVTDHLKTTSFVTTLIVGKANSTKYLLSYSRHPLEGNWKQGPSVQLLYEMQ